MTGSLNAMPERDDIIEQRVFEMLGEYKRVSQIADELGVDFGEAKSIVRKVLRERGTPQLVEIDRSIDRLAAVRF